MMHHRDRRASGTPSVAHAVSAPFVTGRKFFDLILFAILTWSLLASGIYAVIDPVVGWLTGSAGSLVDGGKNLATAMGAGKELTTAINTVNPGSWIAGPLALLGQIAKPVIIALWGLGMLALLLLPKLIRTFLGR